MLRRIPSTPLVCLVVFLSTIILNTAWAAGPDESLEILLKPNQPIAAPAVASPKAKHRYAAAKRTVMLPEADYCAPLPAGISKVKPPVGFGYFAPPCILPRPKVGQWDMGAQVIFARTKGSIGWPRYSPWYSGWWGWENKADFNDDLNLPKNTAWLDLSARYQFRPGWAFRYSVLFNNLSGGGMPQNMFIFGNNWGSGFVWWGWNLQTQWQHAYHRLGLVYDAIRTPTSLVSVFAAWVHTEDRIDLNCTACGYWTTTFSKSGDSASAGIELQKCLKTAANGGTLSSDIRAAAIFLDNVEGWDVQLGGRYSLPLNCGRWGYVKGGYRFVSLNKSQQDLLLQTSLEGGFVEGGLIF